MAVGEAARSGAGSAGRSVRPGSVKLDFLCCRARARWSPRAAPPAYVKDRTGRDSCSAPGHSSPVLCTSDAYFWHWDDWHGDDRHGDDWHGDDWHGTTCTGRVALDEWRGTSGAADDDASRRRRCFLGIGTGGPRPAGLPVGRSTGRLPPTTATWLMHPTRIVRRDNRPTLSTTRRAREPGVEHGPVRPR